MNMLIGLTLVALSCPARPVPEQSDPVSAKGVSAPSNSIRPDTLGDVVDASVGLDLYSQCLNALPASSLGQPNGPHIIGASRLTLLPGPFSRTDEQMQEAGAWLGFIENNSTVAYDPYNVLAVTGSRTCVWIGRKQVPETDGLFRNLRILLVNPAGTVKQVGVVRTFHAGVTHAIPQSFWLPDQIQSPYASKGHMLLSIDLTYSAKGMKFDLEDFTMELQKQLTEAAPWFTCSTHGCCKVQP